MLETQVNKLSDQLFSAWQSWNFSSPPESCICAKFKFEASLRCCFFFFTNSVFPKRFWFKVVISLYSSKNFNPSIRNFLQFNICKEPCEDLYLCFHFLFCKENPFLMESACSALVPMTFNGILNSLKKSNYDICPARILKMLIFKFVIV